MEKDVRVRDVCLPGPSRKFNEMVSDERKRRPGLITDRSNMHYHERKLVVLCPLNAIEVTRLLKALGATKSTRIYWAEGQPARGYQALRPVMEEFSHFYNKEDLALPGELEQYAGRASFMAAIDHIVSERSRSVYAI
ncbi:hypothetical protein MLD38_038265 [Melastoma candidum]|uniref:Uncharacterized protein n=1 Tax=Melastoma candidum TaxID=119954 RepID=A0ACB9KYM0_9MYRT|nr:hypothetical protein MLD38_038265 [Melastoma candidum]